MGDKENEAGLVINGTVIAPGVIETIVSLAAEAVEGVAGAGASKPFSSIKAALGVDANTAVGDIEITKVEQNAIKVGLSLQVYYGYRIIDVAKKVRSAVADALKAQIGIDVVAVDIYINELSFNKE